MARQSRVDGVIERVTFTSEPPEYWQALHGDTIPGDELGKAAVSFTGDEERLVQLYRQYVDPTVELRDLEARVGLLEGGKTAVGKGGYNPWNRWNTVDGIMHLSHPSNTLQAEIQLGADATVLYSLGGQDDPRLVADSGALIARARLGGNNRCSDPTISGSVNHLAALGCALTLANPIGLYMDHIDFAGWSTPKGDEVDPEWFRIVRGQPGLIERAVFEVPHHLGFRVGDLSIGGEAIEYGGQIAERITVKLVALADPEGGFATKPRGLPARIRSERQPLDGGESVERAAPSDGLCRDVRLRRGPQRREFDDLLEAPPAAEPLPRSGRAL